MDTLVESLRPALDNVGSFLTLVGSAVAMLAATAARVRSRWLRALAAAPGWLVLAAWTTLGAYVAGVAGAVGGSTLVLLGVPLAFLVVMAAFSWLLLRWMRGVPAAEVSLAALLAGTAALVFQLRLLWICEPLAHADWPGAAACTADLYASGEGGALRDRGRAGFWYRRSAERGSVAAMYALGGLNYDRDEKRRWFERAAQRGHAGAAFGLYSLDGSVTHLRAAAEAGHAGAQYHLGLLHLGAGQSAQGIEQDLAATRALWLASATAGHVGAMQQLAIAYAVDDALFEASGVSSAHWERRAAQAALDTSEVLPLERALAASYPRLLENARALQRRAEGGDPDARYEIAGTIRRQVGRGWMGSRARHWFEAAAAAGSADAAYQLARGHLEAGDAARATEWLARAADAGHEGALVRVIDANLEGTLGFDPDPRAAKRYIVRLFGVLARRGVERNDAEWIAVEWQLAAAERSIERIESRYLPLPVMRERAAAGDGKAQYHLANELAWSGNADDFETYLELLESSARGGFAQAQYEMARRIRSQPRSAAQERRAVEWLRSAVANGHRGAMVDLAAIYIQGIASIDLARDYERADDLLTRAVTGLEGDVVHAQPTAPGRAWHYTRDTVERWRRQIPR